MDKYLYRLVSEEFKNLREASFKKKFAEDVSEHPADLEPVEVLRYKKYDVHVLPIGLAVQITHSGRWSLYECEWRALERDHLAAWANFARGHWTLETPTQEGMYFAKSRDGRRYVREIRRSKGRTVDVSGGLVRPGEVTTWLGYWWSERIPSLPESL